jgi:hypothetical protein
MLVGLLSIAVSACHYGHYPKQSDVQTKVNDVPVLQTINQGRAYLTVVRDDMVMMRDNLQNIEAGMDTAIFAGATTFALINGLKSQHDKNIVAGILLAAVIGVDSTLSLKQQQAIFNAGLDALLCVEAQSEASYAQVKAYDVVLARVVDDIDQLGDLLQRATAKLAQQQPTPDPELSAAIGLATTDLSNARYWLSIRSVPIDNVNAAVRVAVDNVVQTTVDQLSALLPDGSKFAKISFTPPAVSAPAAGTPPPPNATTPNIKGATKTTGALVAEDTSPLKDPLSTGLVNLVAKLNGDETSADANLAQATATAFQTKLPAIYCQVSGGAAPPPTQALQVPAAVTLTTGAPAVPVNISGATSSLRPVISVAATATGTPKASDITIASDPKTGQLTLAATNSAMVSTDVYSLIVTDVTGPRQLVQIIVVKQQ